MVEQLGELIDRSPTPLTVSLSGAWGVGKSTIAEGLCARRRAAGKPACLVDGWTTEVRDLRRTIAIEVGAAIRGESHRAAIADQLDASLRVTRSRQLPAQIEFRGLGGAWQRVREHPLAFGLALGVFVTALVLAAAIQQDPWETVFTTVASTLAPLLIAAGLVTIITPSESEAPAAESVALAKAFREIVTGGGEAVLVVVDNLDRLSGAEALEALGQIRALVEVDGSRCIFVVPIDRGKLIEHLTVELGGQGGGGREAADDFLQKFFNVEIGLADPEPLDLAALAQRHAARLFPDLDSEQVASSARVIASAAGRVPRAVLRLLNGMSTRYRVLRGRADIAPIELSQLAFIEGLAAVAPATVDLLVREPRRFVQARDAFMQATEENERSLALTPLYPDPNRAAVDYAALRRYLIANADVSVTAADVRLALTLREDRVWSGVDDPAPYVDALEAGDAAAYAAALNDRSDQQATVIERSAYWIAARQEAGLSELALLGIRAISVVLDAHPAIKSRLHAVAAAALPQVPPRFVRALGVPTLQFIFGYAAQLEHPIRQKLADVLAHDISFLHQDAEPITPLVTALRDIEPWVTRLDDITQGIKGRADEELEPLFEPPPLVRVAAASVVDDYLTVLTNWSPTADDEQHARTALLARRLRVLRDAGWRADSQFPELATRLQPQMANVTGSEPVMDALMAIVALLSAGEPGEEIDSLAVALATRGSAEGQAMFDAAYALPMRAPAVQAVATQFLQWIATQPAESVGSTIEKHWDTMEAGVPDLRDQLLGLWIQRQDPGYARLALGGASEFLDKTVRAVNSAPQGQRLARAADAVEVLGALHGRPAAAALDAHVSSWVGQLPTDMLGGLPELIQRMRGHNVPRARLVDTLVAKVASGTAADLEALIAHVRAVATAFGGQQRRRIADAMLERSIALNAGSPDLLGWATENSANMPLVRRAVTQAIARGSATDGTIDLIGRLRQRLSGSAEICEALVDRAYRVGGEDPARLWLEAAKDWKPPSAEENSEFHDQLTALGTQFPNLSDLVESVKRPTD